MADRKWLAPVSALGLWVFLCWWWIKISGHRPMQNDELYSLVYSINNHSLWAMLTGKIDEGNITPLFYMLQKLWIDICHYQIPEAWQALQWSYRDQHSNVLLRMFPVATMAAGVSVIYYYFASRWAIWAGLYSLLISLSSFMVWTYAFESRPYALWFFLTALQMVFLMEFFQGREHRKPRALKALTVVHWLLAFTVIFSVIQQAAACLALWWMGERRLRPYVALCLGPACVCVFYYVLSPKYHFFLAEGFMGLLGASLPQDRILIIAGGAAFLGLMHLQWIKPYIKTITKDQWRCFWAAFLYLVVVFAGCWAVLMLFQHNELPDRSGFQVSNRYFMVLAPIGIMMTTMASYYIVTLPKGTLQKASWIALAVLVGFRLFRTFTLVIFGQING